MRIKLRVDEENAKHVKFTVFEDGANCGQLCMNKKGGAFVFAALAESANRLFNVVEVEADLNKGN